MSGGAGLNYRQRSYDPPVHVEAHVCVFVGGGCVICEKELRKMDAIKGIRSELMEEAERQRLFEALAHGDEEHKRWLREAIDAHLDGKPVPKLRGS